MKVEIVKNLWQVGGENLTAPEDAAIYLVRFAKQAALLDAVYLEAGDHNVMAAAWYGKKMQPLAIDPKIEGQKEIFNIGIGEVLAYHCPGHSPGSLVFTAEIENQTVLFGQDVHGPLDPSLLSNREDYIRSLNFMISLNADILCEGHFGIYSGKENIEAFIKSSIFNLDFATKS